MREYLLADAHPATRMPITEMDDSASARNTPVSRLTKNASGPKGITTASRKVEASTMYGASLKRRSSARSGTRSSFWRNLPTSATSCSVPWGPASMGPSRLCM